MTKDSHIAPAPTRAGQYLPQPGGYRAFIPAPLPPNPPVQLDGGLQRLLSQADRALGRLDGSIQTLPNPDLFVLMYVRKEAVLSSQIEGTQSSLQDLLAAEAQVLIPDRPRDVGEVVNYVRAMNYGLEHLAELPISTRLIRDILIKAMPENADLFQQRVVDLGFEPVKILVPQILDDLCHLFRIDHASHFAGQEKSRNVDNGYTQGLTKAPGFVIAHQQHGLGQGAGQRDARLFASSQCLESSVLKQGFVRQCLYGWDVDPMDCQEGRQQVRLSQFTMHGSRNDRLLNLVE